MYSSQRKGNERIPKLYNLFKNGVFVFTLLSLFDCKVSSSQPPLAFDFCSKKLYTGLCVSRNFGYGLRSKIQFHAENSLRTVEHRNPFYPGNHFIVTRDDYGYELNADKPISIASHTLQYVKIKPSSLSFVTRQKQVIYTFKVDGKKYTHYRVWETQNQLRHYKEHKKLLQVRYLKQDPRCSILDVWP